MLPPVCRTLWCSTMLLGTLAINYNTYGWRMSGKYCMVPRINIRDNWLPHVIALNIILSTDRAVCGCKWMQDSGFHDGTSTQIYDFHRSLNATKAPKTSVFENGWWVLWQLTLSDARNSHQSFLLGVETYVKQKINNYK